MSRRILTVMFLGLMLAVFVAAQYQEETVSVPDDVIVSVSTVAGNITVEGWDNMGEVLVQSEVTGEKVEPVIELKGGKLVIREEHPKYNSGVSGAVNFHVYVPRQVYVRTNTVSGQTGLTALTGDVKMNSVSGSISCEVIDGYVGQMHVNTVSGRIELTLPKGTDADFSANTLSGDVDYPASLRNVHRHDKMVGTQVKGVFGNGAGRIHTNSVSGDIIIK